MNWKPILYLQGLQARWIQRSSKMHNWNKEKQQLFLANIFIYGGSFFLSTYRRYKRNYLNVYTCMFTWLIYSTCHMSHVSTAKVNSDTAYKHTPVDNAWIIFINYYYHTWPFWARYSTCCVVYHKIWTKDHTGLG